MIGAGHRSAGESAEETSGPFVVELRVHGVSGTPPAAMLGESDPKRVAGDSDGQFFRRRTLLEPSVDGKQSQRRVEAYHWGNYTAGAASRALWLIMIPFSLINMARFAQLMNEDRTWRERAHEVGLRLLGLLLTGMLIMASCYICWTIMARQCAKEGCDPGFPLAKWFGQLNADWQLYLFASLVPLAVILLLWLFGKQKIKYNSPGPMRSFDKKGKNGDIGDLGFWRGTHSIVQRIAHIWFAVSLYGVFALIEMGPPRSRSNAWPEALRVGYVAAATLLAVGLILSVLYVIADPKPKLRRELTQAVSEARAREIEVRPDRFMQTLAWITMPAALGAASMLIAGQDHATGHVKTVVEAYDVVTTIFGGAAAVLLVFVFAMCIAQRRSPAGSRLRGDTVPKTFRPIWNGFGTWVLAAFAVMIGYGFAAAGPLLLARAVGSPVRSNNRRFSGAPDPGTLSSPIVIADGYWKIAMLWGILTMILVVVVLPIAFYAVRRWLPGLALLAAGVAALVTLLLSDRFPVWLFATVVLGVGAAAFGVSYLLPGRAFTDRVAEDYTDQNDSNVARVNQQQVARRWRIVLARYRYHHLLGWIALAGGLLVVLSGLVAAVGAFVDLGPVGEFFEESWAGQMIDQAVEITALGVAALTALMAALIVLGISVWRKPKVRTQVGVLWDLLSFWPRMGHPLVPRPYGERAVIAVGERAVQLATLPLFDEGASKDKVVILSGHSQGSVICLAVCAVIDRQCGEDATKLPTEMDANERRNDWLSKDRAKETIETLRLLTYGSQLKFIYARLFPSYFGYERQQSVYIGSLKRRWRNIYRWTDPLGGPVLSWPASDDENGPGPLTREWNHVDSDIDSRPTPRVRSVAKTAGGKQLKYYWWTTGPDIRLRDPETVVETPLAPMLPPKGHSSYPSAAAYDSVVEDLVGPPKGD